MLKEDIDPEAYYRDVYTRKVFTGRQLIDILNQLKMTWENEALFLVMFEEIESEGESNE